MPSTSRKGRPVEGFPLLLNAKESVIVLVEKNSAWTAHSWQPSSHKPNRRRPPFSESSRTCWLPYRISDPGPRAPPKSVPSPAISWETKGGSAIPFCHHIRYSKETQPSCGRQRVKQGRQLGVSRQQ